MTKLHSLLIAFSIIIANGIYCQGLDYTWAEESLGSDWQTISNAKVDQFGNTYIIGYHRASEFSIGGETVPYLGSDIQDGHLIKMAPNGEVVWTKSFGQLLIAGYNMEDLAIDEAGDIYLVGNALAFFAVPTIDGIEIPMYGNFVQAIIIKVDSDGLTQWVKGVYSENVGGTSSRIDRIEMDSSGNLVMLGNFSGQLDLDGDILTSSGDTEDTFIAKTDSDGNFIWGFSFGSEFGRNTPGDIVTNGDDEIFVSTIWTGSSIVVGSFTEENPDAQALSNYDRLIAKFSEDGMPVWTSREGSIEEDFIAELVSDDDGGVISVAASQGQITINESNYDISGLFLSAYNFEGGSSSVTQISSATAYNDVLNPFYPIGIARDGSDNLIVMLTSTDESVELGGITLDNSGGDFGTFDIFIASIGTDGVANWGQVIGTDDNEFGSVLSPDQDGGYIIGGIFRGFELTIGDFVLENPGFPERSYFVTSANQILGVLDRDEVQPMNLFPNPTQYNFSIDLTDMEEPFFSIEIHDISGRLIYQENLQGNGLRQVDVSNFPNGVYAVSLKGKENSYFSKLIKQ